MNKKTYISILAVALLMTAIGYLAGRSYGQNELIKEEKYLQGLNRSALDNMVIDEGPIYVIGHRSPDTDTVCSAIAYARLLNELGYDAKAVISEMPNRETAYILNEAGVVVPEILYDASGLNIFLVDHSEYAQAIDGMDDAHIVGILDHHGVGTVTTGHQIVYEGRPAGSTATIIWLDYLNYGADIDKETAYLLLGAVLSDTYGLTGSTVCEADREAVKVLADIAGVSDTDALYRKIHEESLSYEGMTAEEIIFSDYKEYEASGYKFGIGLVSAIDEEKAISLSEQLMEVLPECAGKVDVDMFYVSVGMRENGEKIDHVLAADDFSEMILKNCFPNYDEYDGTAYIYKTGLGRKTIFVPGLTDYLAAHPHE